MTRKLLVAAALASWALSTSISFGQSSTGSIYGSAQPGATVTVQNPDTGLTRSITVGADGKFNVAPLPVGTYSVTLEQSGQAEVSQIVGVTPGTGTLVGFEETLSEVVITASTVTPIDTSTAQVSTTFSAEVIRQIPVAQNITDIALLAPGTTQGDSRMGGNNGSRPGNLASFGGASVAENSYYINGFNVTNLFQNLAYSQLPFYAIASQQVITGGYGPQYGLSTGGVVNLVTKSGTNNWAGGAAVTWEPDELRSESPRTYTKDGQPYRDYSKNTDSQTVYDVWVGGPIIQDKLFVFGAGEFTSKDTLTYPRTWVGGNVTDIKTEAPFALLNVDWNISDKHLMQFTAIRDNREYAEKDYSSSIGASGFSEIRTFSGTDYYKEGGNIVFGKYSGNLTDNLTLTAQYGQLTNKREQYQVGANGARTTYNGVVGDFNQSGCSYVTYQSAWITANPGAATPSCHMTPTVGTENGKDKRKAGRADLVYKLPFALAGTHTVGAGYEDDRWSSFSGETYSGGTWYRYQRNSAGTQNQVRVRHFQTGADVAVNTKAYYLKDDWQVTDKLLVQLGVRNDSFDNLNGDGKVYVAQHDIIQPRFAFAWDVAGDSSKKLYASYGIYSLPIAATVAVRGASASIFSQQNFTYTGIDPVTGVPTGLTPVNALTYLNHETGQPLDPDSVASKTLDPTKQVEYILGYQMQFGNNWTAGIRGTYRNLLKTIDDMCDLRPFENWATANGLVFDDTNMPGCLMFNPGSAIDANVDVDGDGVKERVYLTPEEIGSPEAKRKYYSVELTLEKAWTDSWYTQFSYTWAHNYGNAEGLVKSDIGQDDTGVTQDFDFPELMRGAEGNLPNDRRHTFKVLSAFKPLPEWTLSSNLLLQTGRPRNCYGLDAVTDADFGYLNSYFFCDGEVVPRGSVGRTSTIVDIDLAAVYSPMAIPGLSLKASVYNVFNGHGTTYYQEEGEDSSGLADDGFGASRSYQKPRYVQLTVEYRLGKE